MSRILRRPMFRGGPVDSRGSGITSGLMDGGRVGYNRGMLVQPPSASGLFSIQDILKQTGAPMTGQQIFDYAAEKGMNLGNRNLNLKSKYIPETVEVGVGEDIIEKPFSEIIREKGFQTYQDPNEDYLGKGDTQGEIGDIDLGEGRTFSKDFGTTEDVAKNLEKKIDDTTKVEEVSFSADADGDVTTVDENDLDSLIDRYYKQLGGDKAARRYGEDVLGTISSSLLEGKGFKGALADATKVKSDAPKIKQAAAMLGIKGEQAQKLYETKLKNTSGMFTKKVEEIMKTENVTRSQAVKMALGSPGTLGESFIEFTRKSGMRPSEIEFDAIAEGYTKGALPADYKTSKPTGTYYIPGEMLVVEVVAGEVKSRKSYKDSGVS